MTSIILVTGGAGFLGSYPANRLIADGHEVLCVGNFRNGSKDNIRHLIGRCSTNVENRKGFSEQGATYRERGARYEPTKLDLPTRSTQAS